ncbi:chorismate mutase [Mangrovicoccus algicola]|uniref:chorismate mutase n=1 Tax=Mangrovicoccus algicola TaxID=2771008 RepID=A0A8J7CYU4_9RHOB|nr:chorismate mutase [Mangrovicoccus algicola]MBE3640002.1 chorismate mutase [Mangrovicoccus algicola]
MKAPSQCRSMTELRQGIDALDRQIVALLRQRQDYIDRAIQLKPAEGLPARIDARVSEVIANVRASALARGLDPDLAASLWRSLIEWSIAREQAELGAGEAGTAAAEPPAIPFPGRPEA